METVVEETKNHITLSSLFNRLSIDTKGKVAENDIKTLCSNLLKSSKDTNEISISDEVKKWIKFAECFLSDSKSRYWVLDGLNVDLSVKSVLLGNGLTPSEADIVVFSVVHSFVFGLSESEREKFPHVMRWMDWIQNRVDLEGSFEMILIEKTEFKPQVQKSKSVEKVVIESKAENVVQNTKKPTTPEVGKSAKKSEDVEKVAGNNEAAQEKKKVPVKETVEKETELSVSLLNIQVGLIRKAWKHPSADSLLVEEIDVGDPKLRQVVSGLAKFYSPDDLTNRRVVLITNVKPGKLRDVMSEGLVLCASNDDHTMVEPLIPPDSAKVGERVSFSGHDGAPEAVLNPKKKQLEKITPHLFTDDNGVAMFKGIQFMTSGGPCTSSIPKATIK